MKSHYNFNSLIIFTMLIFVTQVTAQNYSEPFTLHKAVGSSIDKEERAKYDLFPEFEINSQRNLLELREYAVFPHKEPEVISKIQ